MGRTEKQKMADKMQARIAEALEWKEKDRSPMGRISDVYGARDGFCGECKATKKASRSIKLSEIRKVAQEGIRAQGADWVLFIDMEDEIGRKTVAVIDFDRFKNFLEIQWEATARNVFLNH